MEESQRVNQYFEHKNLPYIALQDGQVLVVDGEKEEFPDMRILGIGPRNWNFRLWGY